MDDVFGTRPQASASPNRVRHTLSGTWSRRITEEHRLVYPFDGDDRVILQARFHYK
ncbi:MAG: type II toxin-antitoxin system YoeB family toxin [Humibacillus sp.]|nr:type II toxin-antitoxin system YoeB family toxin [Humibacillus sp.]